MRHGEWRLTYPDADLLFGIPDLVIWNRTTPIIGGSDLRTGDTDRSRSDGRAFGRDYTGGQTVSFDLLIRAATSELTREAAERLRAVWRADRVRSIPGAVAELRASYDGRERSAFGRPRRIDIDYSDVTVNRLAAVTCDFACADDLWYGDPVATDPITIAPPTGGGLVAPLVAPLTTTATSDRSSVIRIDSAMPVWPAVRIHGPITNPVVTVGPVQFDVRMALAYDQELVIDARPWARTATVSGVSVAGLVRGTRLAEASLPAGQHEITMRGTDPTGTASVSVEYRAVYSSL